MKTFIKIDGAVVNLDFCSFSIERKTVETMDPYDLAKMVKVSFNVLCVNDAVSQKAYRVKMTNSGDLTLKKISEYIKTKGISLNIEGGKFEYIEDTVG